MCCKMQVHFSHISFPQAIRNIQERISLFLPQNCMLCASLLPTGFGDCQTFRQTQQTICFVLKEYLFFAFSTYQFSPLPLESNCALYPQWSWQTCSIPKTKESVTQGNDSPFYLNKFRERKVIQAWLMSAFPWHLDWTLRKRILLSFCIA